MLPVLSITGSRLDLLLSLFLTLPNMGALQCYTRRLLPGIRVIACVVACIVDSLSTTYGLSRIQDKCWWHTGEQGMTTCHHHGSLLQLCNKAKRCPYTQNGRCGHLGREIRRR